MACAGVCCVPLSRSNTLPLDADSFDEAVANGVSVGVVSESGDHAVGE